MGIVARPVGDFVNGTVADGDQVDSDFNAIYNEFNGNIDNNNLKSAAAIDGNKLANAPSGVPTAKINDLAVTTAKLADDAVTGAKLQDHASDDSQRAVTTNHIKDANVLKAKLALTVWSNPGLITLTGGLDRRVVDTGLLTASTLPVSVYLASTADLGEVVSLVLFQDAGKWWVQIFYDTSGTIAIGQLNVAYLS